MNHCKNHSDRIAVRFYGIEYDLCHDCIETENVIDWNDLELCYGCKSLYTRLCSYYCAKDGSWLGHDDLPPLLPFRREINCFAKKYSEYDTEEDSFE